MGIFGKRESSEYKKIKRYLSVIKDYGKAIQVEVERSAKHYFISNEEIKEKIRAELEKINDADDAICKMNDEVIRFWINNTQGSI